jgi:hypothetical protein
MWHRSCMQKRSNLQLRRNNTDYSIPKLVSGCCNGLAYFISKNSYKNTCHTDGQPIYILIANYSSVSTWTKGVACRQLNITETQITGRRMPHNSGWTQTEGNLFLSRPNTISARKSVFLLRDSVSSYGAHSVIRDFRVFKVSLKLICIPCKSPYRESSNFPVKF